MSILNSIKEKIKNTLNKINWSIRFQNINFWYAFIPALLLVLVSLLAIFGIEIDLSEMGDRVINFIEAIFGVLVIIGIINDPTTEGYGDSIKTLNKTTLKKYDDTNECDDDKVE